VVAAVIPIHAKIVQRRKSIAESIVEAGDFLGKER
jgi:hypothetical protein